VNALDANTADDLVQETLTSALANPDTDTDTDTDTVGSHRRRTPALPPSTPWYQRRCDHVAVGHLDIIKPVHDRTVAMLGAVAGWRHGPGGGAYRIADGDAP
jgi:hypothetical protein